MAKKNSRWAVNLTALVLAVGLLMGYFTGCPNGSGPNRPNESAQPNGQVQPTDPSIFKTDKHGKITGYKCAKEELPAHLVIPAKIENEEIKEIGWGAFEDCTGLTSISLPANLTEIGEFAFSGCTGLTSVHLPANLTEIGYGAFEGCTGLTSVHLPASLTKIGGSAFYNCKGLTSISLPAGLTQIDENAFRGCTGLASVHLPANLTEIDRRAFYGCTGLINLTIDSANAKYKTEGNILYNKAGTTLIFAAGGLTSANIPDTVTTIGGGAFEDCTGLRSISLPANLTTIGGSAFAGCTGLTSISLPANLTEIGQFAFYECTGLTSVDLPANLAQIGRGAFYGCEGLTSAVFVDKNNWKVYDDEAHTQNETEIGSSDLENEQTAAKYLREGTYNGGYGNKYWKKD